MLYVVGPFKYNGVPLRRVNQRYVIATRTKLRLKNFKVPSQLDDKFFRRQDLKPKKSDDKIFAEEEKVILIVFYKRPNRILVTFRNIPSLQREKSFRRR